MHHPTRRILLPLPLLLLLGSSPVLAQQSQFELDETGDWEQTQAPEPGTDASVMAEATRLLAEEQADESEDLLADWLDENKRSRNPYLAQGYYLRGLARLQRQREYKALFDFETVIRDFPESPYFLKAVEKEYEIGLAYINGLKRRFLGFRWENARLTGEELLIRTQERLPGSELAEEAAMRLADHYYQRRELKLAAEMYAIFRKNYPDSSLVQRAMLREIEANIARFKGPRYDGSGLVDAKLLIEQYQRRFPAQALRSGVTDGLMAWIDESAAQQSLEIALWYLDVDDEPSAWFTLSRLVRRHPVTDAADEALKIMLAKRWIVMDTEPLDDNPEPGEFEAEIERPVVEPEELIDGQPPVENES